MDLEAALFATGSPLAIMIKTAFDVFDRQVIPTSEVNFTVFIHNCTVTVMFFFFILLL